MPLISGFPPIATKRAQILILGSMPGLASLNANEYYAHPRNQFWPIVCALLGIDALLPYESRLNALHDNGIAVWDVIKDCSRNGSLDSAIVKQTIVPNDFVIFFRKYPSIRSVFFNGATAENLFRKFYLTAAQKVCQDTRNYKRLPSTSPANAALSLERKLETWKLILN